MVRDGTCDTDDKVPMPIQCGTMPCSMELPKVHERTEVSSLYESHLGNTDNYWLASVVCESSHIRSSTSIRSFEGCCYFMAIRTGVARR